MSKNKDELFSEIVKLSEKHGFVVDNEMLNKAVREYDVSLISDEELIKRCQAVALTIYGTGKKGSDLIYELAGRYKNAILTKEAEAILQTADVEKSSKKEDENVKEMIIKTVRGDIPVKVIKMNEEDIKIVGDVFADFFTGFK